MTRRHFRRRDSDTSGAVGRPSRWPGRIAMAVAIAAVAGLAGTPAFAGDRIILRTWVADFRKVRSMRRYEFLRGPDQQVLARGETDWVFVDAATGRPRAVPPAIVEAFETAQLPAETVSGPRLEEQPETRQSGTDR